MRFGEINPIFVFPCIQRLKNDFDFRFSVQKAIYSVFQFHFCIPFPVPHSNSVSGSAQAVRRRKIVMGGGNFVIPARRDNVAGSTFRFQFRFRFPFQRGARTIDDGGNAKMCWSCVRPALEHLRGVTKMFRIGSGGGHGGKNNRLKKVEAPGSNISPGEK